MDFGIQGEVVYLVMELLTGRTLEDEMALGGRMSVGRAIEIVVPVLSVLASAHGSGIIHRDVKPANIFLHHTPRGEVVKVLDFGIAKLLDAPQMTTVGVVLGTPAFMAPERFTGGKSDPSGDVYSLGTMLFQMLTGRLPFVPDSPDPMALAEMKVKQDPPPARSFVPEIPEVVDTLLTLSLSRNPVRRPNAADLAAGLLAAAPQGGGGSTLPEMTGEGGLDVTPEPTAVMPALDLGGDADAEPVKLSSEAAAALSAPSTPQAGAAGDGGVASVSKDEASPAASRKEPLVNNYSN
jgi:serine/threonine protein kinase